MAAESFKPGDVVSLKSGGPVMTVNKVIDSDKDPAVKAVFCVYYNPYQTKFTYVDFYDYALEKKPSASIELEEKCEQLEKELVLKDEIIETLREQKQG